MTDLYPEELEGTGHRIRTLTLGSGGSVEEVFSAIQLCCCGTGKAGRTGAKRVCQTGSNNAPAEPALQASLAMIRSAVRLAGSQRQTDAIFHAHSEARTACNPG